jgi:hypothetical protein
MHFRSDEKFLKITKILEIKNKRDLSGVCSDILLAKMTLPQYIFGLCDLNTLVQVGEEVVSVKKNRW